MHHSPTHQVQALLAPLRRLHNLIRAEVVAACERSALETLSAIARDEAGDTIYALDCISEELLIDFLTREVAPLAPFVLIAEGLHDGKMILPHGATENEALWRIIIDPIDGTRGLMYQKRSGWILTGVAPNRGPETCLSDIVLAVQTEIPLLKQHLSDVVWAVRGHGADGVRVNRLTSETVPLALRPSAATTIAHGYAQISRFFPGARDELAALDEALVSHLLGPVQAGKAHCFEDQYASTGGQLYELLCGHDRFTADLRPLLDKYLQQRGLALGICCHPYDLCTELIAREAGVKVTAVDGGPVRARLAVEPDVAWLGYANAILQAQIEPVLQKLLAQRGWL